MTLVGGIVPAWSPDGSTIAFARQGGTEGVFSIPARGGPRIGSLRTPLFPMGRR